MRVHHFFFLAAAGVLLAAIVFGFATQPPPTASPYNKSGQLVERTLPHGREYIGGGPAWAVFERGVIYGDGALTMEQSREETVGGAAGHAYSFTLPSPLENSLMWSSSCSDSQGESMDEIRGRAECGRSIRWIDVSNPTPFMLAMLLCGTGWILKARRSFPKPDPVS